MTINVTGKSASAPRNIAITLTSDKTTLTTGGKIRFTSTVTNIGPDPLVFFDEKSGQCQSSQFYFNFDGKSSTHFFLAPGGWFAVAGVCAQTAPTIITLLSGESYSVYYDAEIPPVDNDESVPPYAKNVPQGQHVVNAQVRLWGPGRAIFWEGNSNNLTFTVQ